ncbi:MAG: PQQ-binding-like beta-propeller repeat protein [Chloroflexota bacterium]|nr:PQQ-binding-like beta-propeller repeat protein [Chloroflexota bacterium]
MQTWTTSAVLPPRVVLSGATVYATQGSVYALQADTGVLHQRYQIQGAAYPTVMENVMYVNVNYLFDHTLQALHLRDGSLLWSYQAEGSLSYAPIVLEDIIYSSSRGIIFALHVQDGSLLWQYTVNSKFSAFPTIVEKVVYVSPSVNPPLTPSVYALHSRNGTLLWQTPISNSTSFPRTVRGGVMYISTYKECSALSTRDGSSIREHKITGRICSPPIVENGTIYISLVTSRDNVSFFASNQPDPMEPQEDIFIYALRADDGSLLWKQQIGSNTGAGDPTTPAVTHDAVYVGADDGFLYALRTDDDTPLWSYKTGGTLLSSPIVANRVVYVGANDGYVYALRASDGVLLWQTFVSVAVTAASSISIR